MANVHAVERAIDFGHRYQSGALLITPDGDVFSYGVCIFRVSERKFHSKKYSVTTSRHQNLVRAALANAGIKYTETEEELGRLGVTK